jgi:regulator of protease activity HflC (stomatin/prohibitin superfamily)
MNTEQSMLNREKTIQLLNGWIMLPIVIALLLGGIALVICTGIALEANASPAVFVPLLILGILLIPFSIVMMIGFFALQPNEARVLVLFGDYRGTVRESGFHWGNPFYSNGPHVGLAARTAAAQAQAQTASSAPAHRKGPARMKVSLRTRNFNSERLKVNDKRGNPIEIAAVVVWQVRDTAQAMFDVDDYENYVRIQSEAAIRHLASAYAYDHGEDNEVTLRGGGDEVAVALRGELQTRLDKAGVIVEEARLTHLAYAPEIAHAMLRRQQAEAVIAARQKIVHGAVSMVDMALRELAANRVVQLDEERKAAMVSNLMVVLCSESEVHPVVNTGTLYP